MSWEILLLGCLICVITIVAFIAMRKTKPSEFSSFRTQTGIDADELATKIAKAIAVELRTLLKELPNFAIPSINSHHVNDEEFLISIDDSLIPTKIVTDADLSNLKKVIKDEIQVDKDLDKSKAKLAQFLKRKKET